MLTAVARIGGLEHHVIVRDVRDVRGDKPVERILIRRASFYAKRQIDLLLGRTVTAVDPAAREVTLGDGAAIGYGSLIWATGGRARKLTCSGHRLRGVHGVRTRRRTRHS